MAKWIGTKRRKERKEAKKGRGKKTMIRGACIAGPSNIQYGPEGERGREGHARITTYPARQRVRTCYGWKAYPGNPLRRETWIRSRARSHARPAVPWTRYRERESPTTLSNWSAPDPIPRSSHIDADNYAYARSLSVPFPRRGFRGFPNCEIGIGSRLLYRAREWMNGWECGVEALLFRGIYFGSDGDILASSWRGVPRVFALMWSAFVIRILCRYVDLRGFYDSGIWK